jgi:hypothetical protein
MAGGTEEQPPRTGGENPGVDADVAGTGDEGARAEQASPRIADDAAAGRTSVPAEGDDVGVPPDEEMESPPDE